MKEKYEQLTLTITEFDAEDVITTSADYNNSFTNINNIIGPDGRRLPNGWGY